MGLFGSKKEGGIMDVIRCDQSDYLIWKWSPSGEPSRKMNAIRYGSRLRVKEGEVAVFVYDKEGGMDFIEGFKDEVIKTANFPILSSIVGAAFGGASPFQAEVFFINRAGTIRLPFFVRNITLTEPEQQRLTVPATVKGSITFNIQDYRAFISKYQMAGYSMDDLSEQIREMLIRYVKNAVTNAPFQLGIPVVQIERGIDQISEYVQSRIVGPMADDYAINVRRIDISDISLDSTSPGYQALMKQGMAQADILSNQFAATSIATSQNILDQQRIASENLEESMRINREETQRRQRLSTEDAYIRAHQINVQGEVARTAAESLGMMGATLGDGGSGGMNPAGMMAGMMMGGAVGSNMAGMMGSMMQNVAQPQAPTPPPAATTQYFVVVNGAQAGPYSDAQIRQMIGAGQLNKTSYIWKQGMAAWDVLGSLAEFADAFGAVPPPIPPVPPVPPVPPTL
ncbi:MAG: SPFH domain-containing protein [Alistipes sp.]|nr:SPFH domain-containing protein [Alistipes sp.]